MNQPLLAIKNAVYGRGRSVFQLLEACQYRDAHVWMKDWGNQYVLDALSSAVPQAIGKLGSTELQALRGYLRYRGKPNVAQATEVPRTSLYTFSGVFPDEYPTYARFCESMLTEVLPQMTVVQVWFNIKEASIVNRYCRKSVLVSIHSLGAFRYARPWTGALRGKRVLVLHPFVNTIREQYAKRALLWPTRPEVLPEFELLQIRVPHYPCLVPPTHRDWFAALEDMKAQMAAMEFDVALIGAGAYSLPLAVHAKALGRHAVHLGGSLQIYFGIRGHRWDQDPLFQPLFNEHWSYPLQEDTPTNTKVIENSCYW